MLLAVQEVLSSMSVPGMVAAGVVTEGVGMVGVGVLTGGLVPAGVVGVESGVEVVVGVGTAAQDIKLNR